MEPANFEIDIYQIAADDMFRMNRTDGTGWEWRWADWRRDWMDASPSMFAYRCLPLTIANQIGWWILNPVGFTATWNGGPEASAVTIKFDTAEEVWKPWINNQFGLGIITWNTPFLFRTRPAGSRLLVGGPGNFFKSNLHPLTAVIESDWLTSSFTMNWKIMSSNLPVRFERGEPLMQITPLATNFCADMEKAAVTYRRLNEDPAMHKAYVDWMQSRNKFHDQKKAGEVAGTAWQKHYFHGKDMTGQEAAPAHVTRITPPGIKDMTAKPK
jgi:hypothetical protein